MAESDWARLGKSLLLITGLTYLRLSLLTGAEPLGPLTRAWLGLCGAGCTAVALLAMMSRREARS